MPVIGRGRIVLWEGASLWMLEAEQESAEVQPHRHHAIQITFQLKGAFEIGSLGDYLGGPIVAVRSDAPHSFRASGAVAFLFVEPESAVGRALDRELFLEGPVASLTTEKAISWLDTLRACLTGGPTEEEMLRLGRKIVDELPTPGGSRPIDPRVQRMIAYAVANLEDGITLSSTAAHINLSQSRARHLFVAQTGLPFKTYVLWLRLERAVQLYAGGQSLTEAAHEAGFADSAHFSRTFRRTFGLPAAALRLESTERKRQLG